MACAIIFFGGNKSMKKNPYRPGAGLMPICLAGRDEEIGRIEDMFDAMKNGIPVQSVMYTGLRGVGKTVLLNRLEKDKVVTNIGA